VVRNISGGLCTVTVTVANPPQAHAKAVAQFRLASWAQWSGQAIEPVQTVNGVSLGGTFPDLGSPLVLSVVVPAEVNPATGLSLLLAVVDPVDRMSDLATITVP